MLLLKHGIKMALNYGTNYLGTDEEHQFILMYVRYVFAKWA